MTIQERVLAIGAPWPLHGVLTEPAVAAAVPGLAVVIPNSGVLHKVGTCRFAVRLARLAAAQGMTAVRFDAAGIGDSRPHVGRADVAQDEDLQTVLTFLRERHGMRRFIVVGHCSGAHAGFAVACRDESVQALGMIDPYSYRTLGWRFRHYAPRLLKPHVLVRATARALGVGRQSGERGSSRQLFEVPSFAPPPPRSVVAAGLSSLVGRRVPLHVVFTGGMPDSYNYEGQYRECFSDVAFGDMLDFHYLPDSSHIMTEPGVQERVLDGIGRWLAGPARG